MKRASKQIKNAALLLAMIFFIASCAASSTGTTAKAKKKAYDPTGSWEYYVDTPDGGSGGTMTISGSPGAYTGTLSTDQFGTLELTGLDVVDTNMTATIEVMGTGADIEVAFDGDTFSGVVYLGEDAFPMEGKRTSK